MHDFASEGLLDGLEGRERQERVELLGDLQGRGVGVAEMRRATEEGRLVFLAAEIHLGGVARYTEAEVAERSGLDAELLRALRRAQGVPVLDPAEAAYTDGDLETATLARRFLDAGIAPEDILDISRILGRAFVQAAEAMRAVALRLVLEPGASEAALARGYAEQAAQLLPPTEELIVRLLGLHLRHMVRSEAISVAELRSGQLPGARETSVAFADLVGFTRLGEEIPVDELGRIARRLGELAGEVVSPPVRVVKLIGDAAMLASPEPGPLVDAALALLEAAETEADELPQLRVGMACGAAISRAGDVYGHPVNLASRVTAVARAGSVLATGDLHDAVEDGYRWSFAGARHLKGIRGAVPLYRARRRED